MRKGALVIGLLLLIAACGDSGETVNTEPAATVTTSAADVQTTTTSAQPCPAAPFTGSIERTVEAETSNGTHVATVRSDGALVSAYAFDFGTGDTYTIYVGDFEIEEAGVGSDTLVAPAGGMLATIFLMSESEIVAGSSLELTFVPIIDTGGGAEISGFGIDDLTGSVDIIAVTDDVICFEIKTTDPQQTVNGIVSAEIAKG